MHGARITQTKTLGKTGSGTFSRSSGHRPWVGRAGPARGSCPLFPPHDGEHLRQCGALPSPPVQSAPGVLLRNSEYLLRGSSPRLANNRPRRNFPLNPHHVTRFVMESTLCRKSMATLPIRTKDPEKSSYRGRKSWFLLRFPPDSG